MENFMFKWNFHSYYTEIKAFFLIDYNCSKFRRIYLVRNEVSKTIISEHVLKK